MGSSRDKMHRVTLECKELRPSLGMDAATVSNEKEDHDILPIDIVISVFAARLAHFCIL